MTERSGGTGELNTQHRVTEHPAGEPLDATLERADKALYAAKAAGRQRTEVLPATSRQPRERPLAEQPHL